MTGAAGISNGTISGTVTNKATGTAVAGAVITTDPAIGGVSLSTDSTGKYSANLPMGTYTFTVTKTYFATSTLSVSVVAGQAQTKNVSLTPSSHAGTSAPASEGFLTPALSRPPVSISNIITPIEYMSAPASGLSPDAVSGALQAKSMSSALPNRTLLFASMKTERPMRINQIGHFYFGKNRTFLLWLDRVKTPLVPKVF